MALGSSHRFQERLRRLHRGGWVREDHEVSPRAFWPSASRPHEGLHRHGGPAGWEELVHQQAAAQPPCARHQRERHPRG
eukprot:7420514-Alexandrium_andersonii.AAC.1